MEARKTILSKDPHCLPVFRSSIWRNAGPGGNMRIVADIFLKWPRWFTIKLSTT
jgi:hypothetical protein